MMDKDAVQCAENYVGAGYPLDAEGLLIVELDGPEVEVDYLVARVEEIARGRGATTVRVSRDEQERVLFWAGRKAAFPAVGQITPTICVSTARCRAAGWSRCWARCA